MEYVPITQKTNREQSYDVNEVSFYSHTLKIIKIYRVLSKYTGLDADNLALRSSSMCVSNDFDGAPCGIRCCSK